MTTIQTPVRRSRVRFAFRWSGLLLIAALLLLFASTTYARAEGLWMQQFMEMSPNQWSVYQRKVEMVSKETGNTRFIEESPTLIAMKGLDALLRKNVPLAKTQAALLEQFAVTRHNATWFEFRWDYSTSWPYKLKAPWVSGLAQGLGLSLNTWLYQATKEARYLNAARDIAKSYLVPIEKGGFVRSLANGSLNFEEYPVATPTHVLNGAALATLALQDYVKVSGEKKYDGTLTSAYAWWNENISRYQVVDPAYPEVVSAYSLAPNRNELLFRFLSDTSFNVQQIVFKAENGDPLTLQVGNVDDADRSSNAFLWFNPKFQNWSESKKDASGKYRSVVPKQGEYNHAPFTFSVVPETLKQSATLQLQVESVHAGEVLVQLYTGKEYVPIGKIALQGERQTFSFPISAQVLSAFRDAETVPPPVEPAYFTDNYLLVSLLAQAGHSPALERTAQRFEASASLTPGIYDASPRTRWLLGEPQQFKAPTGHGIEAWHTEYPSVLIADGRWQLFYSAIGEDSRWRIMHATSDDQGKNWGPPEQVLDESLLEFQGSYAFPNVLYDKVHNRYMMVFSADFDQDGKYDAVMLMESPDLKTWTPPRRVASEGGLAPILWYDDEYYHIAYTIKDGEAFHVMEMQSLDRLSWTLPKSIASARARAHSGFYTLARLPRKNDFFMMERFQAPGRIEWRVMCRAADSTLIDVSKSPFYVLGAHPGRWDDYQYGMSFFRAPDDRLLLFLNGIPFGAEHGGSMAMVEVDEEALWKNIDSANCH